MYEAKNTSLLDCPSPSLSLPLLPLSVPAPLQAPMPDVYRGKHQSPETAGELYAEEIGKIIEQRQAEDKTVAAFIHESILCSGGIVMPDGFLEASYRYGRGACDTVGLPCCLCCTTLCVPTALQEGAGGWRSVYC